MGFGGVVADVWPADERRSPAGGAEAGWSSGSGLAGVGLADERKVDIVDGVMHGGFPAKWWKKFGMGSSESLARHSGLTSDL